MEKIGEKIRALRIAKRMTQAELAGDQITRNMLSLVENGSALPSLPTIMYLSERLGVPAGIFLARENDELIYKKISELPKIKNAYKKGEYKLCCDMCDGFLGDRRDDEISFILALCHFEIAKEEFYSGRLHRSCREFDLACTYCDDTTYKCDAVKCASSFYFEYMLRLSPTLTSDMGYDAYNGDMICEDAFCRYANALKHLEAGDINYVTAYLSLYEEKDKGFAEHIRALFEMQSGNYAEAGEHLRHLISGNDVDCRVIMYDIFRNLEDCCRETGDYKGAYEYSVGKVELLEHMLTDINL